MAAGAILQRQVELATRALAAARPAAPVCAACLYHGQTELETDFSLPVIALAPEPWRRELLGRMTPYDAFGVLLNPEEAPGEWVEPEHDPMQDAGAVLVPALATAGVWDPQRWLLCRVARALTLAPVPEPRTSDYLAFAFDQDFDHALAENLRFAAPDRVAAAWERLGLLPRRGAGELRGAGTVDVEEVTAHLEEEMDDGWDEFLATFQGHCHAPGAEAGIEGATLGEALAWAGEHTDSIHLTVGHDEFTAGHRPLPGLPPWTGGRAIVRRPT